MFQWIPLLLSLAFAGPVGDCDPDTGYDPTDADADGWTASEDCDDMDASVNPGVDEESCNGRDDNCDCVVDAFELDQDGDGQAPCGGDCADLDPTRSTAAEEIANLIDDDCDHNVDEGTVFGDDDGDGYPEQLPGDEGNTVIGDCDDADPTVHPDAEDAAVPPDGIDNDCDDLRDEGTGDQDGDGDGYSPLDGDCNDELATVYPGAPEINDWQDNDCDDDQPVVQGCGRVTPAAASLLVLPLLRRRRGRSALLALLMLSPLRALAGAPAGSAHARPGDVEDDYGSDLFGVLAEGRRAHEHLLLRAALESDAIWAQQSAEAQLAELNRRTLPMGPEEPEAEARAHQREALVRVVQQAEANATKAEAQARALQKAQNAKRVSEEAHAQVADQWDLADGLLEASPATAELWRAARQSFDAGDPKGALQRLSTIPEPQPLQTPVLVSNLERLIRLQEEAEADRQALLALLPADAQPELSRPKVEESWAQVEELRAQRIQAAEDVQRFDEAGEELEDARAWHLMRARRIIDALSVGTTTDQPPLQEEAAEIANLYQEALAMVIAEPMLMTNRAWTELLWRGGTALILAGDEEAGQSWLENAAAVAVDGLPLDRVPPTVAGWMGRAEANVARMPRGELWMDTRPENIVYVDGVARNLLQGQTQLALQPGYHLIVIDAPGQQERLAQVSYVGSGMDVRVSWFPTLAASGTYPSDHGDNGDELWSPDHRSTSTRPVESEAPLDRAWILYAQSAGIYGQGTGLFGGGPAVAMDMERLQLNADLLLLGATQPLWGANGGVSSTVLVGSAGGGPARDMGQAWRMGAGAGLWLSAAPGAGWMGGGPYCYGLAQWSWNDLRIGLEGRLGPDLALHEDQDAARLQTGGVVRIGLAL